MSKCQICQADGLEFHETLRLNINPITGQKHGPNFCKAILKPNPIARFDNMNGILFDRRPESLAKAITDEAVRCNLNPYTVRIEVRGQFIMLH